MDLNEALRVVIDYVEDNVDFTRYDPGEYYLDIYKAVNVLRDMLPTGMTRNA